MNTLDTIIEYKRQEVRERSELYPVALLQRSPYYATQAVSLKKYLLRPDKTGVIAEFKRKSPSKGAIAAYANPEQITVGYMQAGAAALSVLTDTHFFGGKNEDLTIARRFNFCPILRKDFVVNEYQIFEARSIGADVILLIAAVLSETELKQFTHLAHDLGMEVLTEIHAAEELNKIAPETDVIGVNNRNLKDMSVSLENSIQIAPKIPAGYLKISESGIQQASDAAMLASHGYNGFLIGEQFMRQPSPEKACEKFITELESQLKREKVQ